MLRTLFSLVLFAVVARAQEPCPDRILVSAVGDILVHKAQQIEAHQNRERFYSLWKTISPFISAADVSYGNLESPLALGVDQAGQFRGDIGFKYDGVVYSGTNKIFNFHPLILEDIRKLGIDVLSTANNHALDRKSVGVDLTIQELKKAQFAFTGTRTKNSQDPWYTITNVKGRRIFWLACTEMLNGNTDQHKQILKCFEDQKEIENLVQKAMKSFDAVFLMPHWGDEYTQNPAARQRKWAQRMADLGVTAILGSHPHVLQPLEKIKNTWVAYSLGNFIAWQAGVPQKTAVILYLDLRPRGNKLSVFKIKALPIYRVGTIMYPFVNTLSSEALSYVQKNMGSDQIVSGVDFQSQVLRCE